MAVHTGTCAGYDALLTVLKNFLTGVVGSLPGAEQWTVNADNTVGSVRELLLKGPGYVGPGSINIEPYIQIRRSSSPADGAYWWKLNGATGYGSGLNYENQPGVSDIDTYLLLPESSTIEYWIVASGRRFIVIAKAGTAYHCAYAGFYLAGHTPEEIPFPIFVGGSCGHSNIPYTTTSYDVGSFWDGPAADTGNVGATLRHIDGDWLVVGNYAADNTSARPAARQNTNTVNTVPYYRTTAGLKLGRNYDGASFAPTECTLVTTRGGGQIYGWLDGVYWISGDNNAPENTFTYNGDTYLVLPNVYRTGDVREFAAVRLV